MNFKTYLEWIILLKRLILFQIFAAVLKYFIIGFGEKPVTTLSATGGSVATVFPMMMVVIILAIYLLYKKDKRILYFIPAFLFIGFVNTKRGVWILVPVTLLITYSVWYILNYDWVRSIPYLTRKLPLILLIGGAILYFGVRLNSTLNPDKKVWGEFDLKFTMDFISEYNSDAEYFKKTNLIKGRKAGLEYTLSVFFNDKPFQAALFGIGPEKLVAQEHRSKDVKSTGIESRGSMTGIVLFLWAVGIIPVLIFMVFHIVLLKFALGCFRLYNGNRLRFVAFSAMMLCVVFFLDFLFYTTAFISTPGLQLLFYSFLALGYKGLYIKDMEGNAKVIELELI